MSTLIAFNEENIKWKKKSKQQQQKSSPLVLVALQMEEIEKENKKIVKLKIQMYNLNKIVNRKSKYTVDEGAMLTLEQGCLTDAIKALKKLREEVEATIVAERVRENKMNINLRGRGIDYNSGYDMGF